ncbi:MAG: response regulator transcription factor [Eubacterium sp.]|nr:response regulator transcription factor [Eubacterium sp.]
MIVAVCDDNRGCRREIKAECEKILKSSDIKFDIHEFSNVRALMKELSNIDILLLDIELGEDSGIEVKNYIEENELDIIIIFISGYTAHMPESFGLNVMGFIDKTDISGMLPKYMEKALTRKGNVTGFIGTIDVRNIKYIQSNGVYVDIVKNDDTKVLYRATMKEMETKLTGLNFSRAHRSYIINLKYVSRIDAGLDGSRYAFLGNDKIKISKRRYPSFRKEFSDFSRKRAGYM